jgi:hypothetical protein
MIPSNGNQIELSCKHLENPKCKIVETMHPDNKQGQKFTTFLKFAALTHECQNKNLNTSSIQKPKQVTFSNPAFKCMGCHIQNLETQDNMEVVVCTTLATVNLRDFTLNLTNLLL